MNKTKCLSYKHGVRPQDNRIELSKVKKAVAAWLIECGSEEIRDESLAKRKDTMHPMLDYFISKEFANIGIREIRQFVGSMATRKTNGRMTATETISLAQVTHHYAVLRTFFRWIVQKQIIETSPFDVIGAPVCRRRQVQALIDDEAQADIQSAKASL